MMYAGGKQGFSHGKWKNIFSWTIFFLTLDLVPLSTPEVRNTSSNNIQPDICCATQNMK